MNVGLPDHAGERKPGGDRLRHDHQVGLDLVVLHREHAARAAEACLHLVRDEHDPLPVADRAQPRDELRRGRHEAALAELRLEDDRGNLGGRHVGREHALDAVERLRAETPRYSFGNGAR